MFKKFKINNWGLWEVFAECQSETPPKVDDFFEYVYENNFVIDKKSYRAKPKDNGKWSCSAEILKKVVTNNEKTIKNWGGPLGTSLDTL